MMKDQDIRAMLSTYNKIMPAYDDSYMQVSAYNFADNIDVHFYYNSHERSDYYRNGGMFQMFYGSQDIGHLEDHFLDPLEPTAMENELFKLEFGLDFINIMEKLKYGE